MMTIKWLYEREIFIDGEITLEKNKLKPTAEKSQDS